MIRTQRWTPDTCANPATGDACVFIETWDDAVNPVSRTHDFSQRERVCSRHAGLDPATCFATNYAENRRKNTMLMLAQSVKSTLTADQYKWSFDSNGLLTANFGSAFTANQKSQLQNNANIQYGPGKAVVE
jgi:hypothetical protein